MRVGAEESRMAKMISVLAIAVAATLTSTASRAPVMPAAATVLPA